MPRSGPASGRAAPFRPTPPARSPGLRLARGLTNAAEVMVCVPWQQGPLAGSDPSLAGPARGSDHLDDIPFATLHDVSTSLHQSQPT